MQFVLWRHALAWCGLAALLLGVSQAAGQTAQTKALAEAQLESIRQAIVQAALERPTQVLSTAWIDTNGRLHETAHFQTDAEVRSIRMPSLFDKAAGTAQPVSAVKVDMLPSAWRQKIKSDQACESPKRKLRQPLKVFTRLSSGFDGSLAFHGLSLLAEAQRQWHEQINASSRWWPQDHQAVEGTRYQAMLTSRTSTETAWAVRIGLDTRQAAQLLPEPWYLRVKKKLEGVDLEPSSAWQWQLTITMGTVTPNGSFEASWSEQVPIDVSQQEQLASAQDWQLSLAARLAPVVAHWAKLLDKAWTCEPVQFQVSNTPGDGMTINAGNRSGLNAGDRLLLVAPEHIPQKILENKAMDHLRLAEVVRVGSNQTTIRQLAGPPTASFGRWLALPL